MRNTNICKCRACRSAMRDGGKVLGSRIEKYHDNGQYIVAHVSAYIQHAKFKKGRRVRRPLNTETNDQSQN